MSEDSSDIQPRRTVVAWFVTWALATACADLWQVKAVAQDVSLARLGVMTLVVYAAVGAAAGWIVFSVARRLLPSRTDLQTALFTAALCGWPLFFLVAYINVVHLPSILNPVTIAANFGLLVGGWFVWRNVLRLSWTAAIARRRWAAVSLAVLFAILGFRLSITTGEHPLSERPPAPPGAPHVIVVAVDTLRYDRTGLGETADSLTPAIDRIAADGVGFTRTYAQSSWTKPSVASLLTSRYPTTHGANLRRDRLNGSLLTLPELLQHAGYRTAIFSANPWIAPAFGFGRGVDDFVEAETETFSRLVLLFRMLKLPDRLVGFNPVAHTLALLERALGMTDIRLNNCERDVVLLDRFEKWITHYKSTATFSYMHLMSPHIPYDAPGGPEGLSNTEQVALLTSTEALPEARRAQLIAQYDAAVRYANMLLERLISILQRLDLYDGAILVVTADHGEEFHEHGHWGHGKSLYNELVHVPLVLKAPSVPKGGVFSGASMLVDVMPTLAGLLDLPKQLDWEGRDLTSKIDGRPVYGELIREGGLESYMVVENGFKYIETTAGLGASTTHELYAVRGDEAEQHNRWVEPMPEWPKALAAVRDRVQATRVVGEKVEIDEAAREKLKALGYIN